jgi:hypothetical protein
MSSFGKLINSNNKDAYVESLKISLNTFVEYCNTLEKHREIDGNKFLNAECVTVNGIGFKEYCEIAEYLRYSKIAKDLLENYDKICTNVLAFCYGVEESREKVYPVKMLRMLYDFRDYVYHCNIDKKDFLNMNVELLSLEEQNLRAKNYIHFDFSVKKIKTLNNI